MADNQFYPGGHFIAGASEFGSGSDSSADLLRLVDGLENQIAVAIRIPWLDKVLLDREELLDLIDQMRVALPEDVHDARDLLHERQEVLDAAEREAVQITQRARDEAMARLADTDQVKQAQTLAREIRLAAEQEAASRRRDADAYALEVLLRLEQSLGDQLSTVRGGVQALQSGLRNGVHHTDDGFQP